MSRLRILAALVCSLFMLMMGAATALAAGPAELGSAPAAARSDAREVAPVVPYDVPLRATGTIPPLPPGYVTKDLGWLELSYPSAAGERVASLIEDANAIKAQLTSALGQPVLDRVTVRVAPTVADMARLAPEDAPPPEYASGVAYNGLHFVLLSMLAPRGAEAVNLDEVLRHELAHVALEDAVLGRHVPVWFNEGLATSLSGELWIDRGKTLWSATLGGTLIPLADLDRSFPRDNFTVSIAYAESADFMRHLRRHADHQRFVAMIERVRGGQPFDRAIAEAYGVELRRLEFEWRGDLERRFSVLPILTGGGLVWLLVMGILVAAYVRRRRRSKAILERWAREEAIEDARIAARLAAERAALTGVTSIATTKGREQVPASARPEVLVERDGRWHTLH